LLKRRKSLHGLIIVGAVSVTAATALFVGVQEQSRAGGFNIGPLYVDTDPNHWNPKHFVPHVLDEYVFKDTEDHLEQIATDTLAKSDLLLSKHEELADKLLGRQQHVLAGYLGEATATLSAILKSDIAELREETSYQQRGLALSATALGWNLVGSAAIILFVIGLSAFAYSLVAYGTQALQSRKLFVLIGALAFFSVSLYGLRSYRLWAIGGEFQKKYSVDLENLRLHELIEHSTYLNAIEATDPSSERVKLAHLMRDVLTKPWSYSVEYDGGQTLQDLRDLEYAYAQLCNKKDNPYAFALDSFVEWQASTDRVGEYRSAVAAARALQSASEDSPSSSDCWPNQAGGAFSLAPLAGHYLTLYVSHPLSTDEFALNKIKPTTAYRDLVAIGQKVPQTQNANPPTVLGNFWQYGETISTLLKGIAPAYTVLVYSNAMATHTTGKVHNGYIAAAFAAASRILAAYDGGSEGPGFVAALRGTEFQFRENPAIKAALRDSHVFYYRAWLLRQGQAKDCLDATDFDDSYKAVRQELLGGKGAQPSRESIACVLRGVEVITGDSKFERYKSEHSALWASLVTTRLLAEHFNDSISPAMYRFLEEDSFANLQRSVAEINDAETAILAAVASRTTVAQQASRDALVKAIQDLSKIKLAVRLFVCPDEGSFGCGNEPVNVFLALARGIDDKGVREAAQSAVRRQSGVRDPLSI